MELRFSQLLEPSPLYSMKSPITFTFRSVVQMCFFRSFDAGGCSEKVGRNTVSDGIWESHGLHDSMFSFE